MSTTSALPPDQATSLNPPAVVTAPGKTHTKTKPHFKGQEHTTRTIKTPPWTYIHLSLLSSSAPNASSTTDLDALTARTHLTSALTKFLGLSGSAISVDVLKIVGSEVWIRVPREDGSVVVAAVGGWVGEDVGWKVVRWGNWLGKLVGEEGESGVWED